MYLRQAKSAMEQPRNRLILSGCGQIPVEELYNSAIFRGSLERGTDWESLGNIALKTETNPHQYRR